MAQGNTLAPLERKTAVLTLAKAAQAKGVGSEKTIGPHVPRRGMPETARVI